MRNKGLTRFLRNHSRERQNWASEMRLCWQLSVNTWVFTPKQCVHQFQRLATHQLKKRFENTNLPVRKVECQWIEQICTKASSNLRKREVVITKHSCFTRAQVARVQRTKWCHTEFEIVLTGISGAPGQCVAAFTIKQSMAWIFIVDQPEW